MGQVVLFRWGLVDFRVVVETRVHACAFEVRFRALSRLDFQCKNLYSKSHRETWTQFNTSFQWESMLSLWETHSRQRPSPKKIWPTSQSKAPMHRLIARCKTTTLLSGVWKIMVITFTSVENAIVKFFRKITQVHDCIEWADHGKRCFNGFPMGKWKEALKPF